MQVNIRTAILTAALIIGAPSLTAYAQLPADQTIEYEIRETPTDPTSDVVFIIKMDLTADSIDGSSVGWEIAAMEFRQPDAGGDTVWNEASPSASSRDGLWWIEHHDPQAPLISEFTMPPGLLGTADPADPADDDLNYDLLGVEHVEPPPSGGPPFPVTAALTYELMLSQQARVVEEGEDEPVKVPEGSQQ